MAQSRVPQVVAVLTAVALGATLLAGCGGDDEPAPAPTIAAPPIAELKTAGMAVVRVDFCDLVPRTAVRRALAGAARSASAWTNGDPVPGGKPGDVGHEVGCAWKGTGGRAARAWVFARPVSAAFARSLVRDGARQQGCRAVPGPAFGSPTLTQVCTVGKKGVTGGVTRFRHAGLFGDTWLTCEVTGPGAKRDDVRSRTGSWCVSVATTLDRG